METFLQVQNDERLGIIISNVRLFNFFWILIGFSVNNQTYITQDGWLSKWAQLVAGAKNIVDFPIWLQYFIRVMFQVINRSGKLIINYGSLLRLRNHKMFDQNKILFLPRSSKLCIFCFIYNIDGLRSINYSRAVFVFSGSNKK